MSIKGIVYIHPGIGKTATTAIQNIAMHQLNGELKYFPFGLKGDVHNYLSDVHPIFNETYFKTELDKINQLSKDNNYLISSEFLCYSTREHISYLCKKIIDAGFKVQVIFAVRDLVPLIQSTYLQSLKSSHGLVPGESMLAFYQRNKQQFSYSMLIEKWSSNEDVTVAVIEFEKYGKNFVQKFFEYLGAEVTGTQQVSNSSVHIGFAELITTLDKSITDFEAQDRIELIDLLLRLSDKYRGSITHENDDINVIKADLNSLNTLNEITKNYEVI